MNSCDVLLLAAGRGSRMGELTKFAAKPSLNVGGESLISRLVRQVSSIEGLGRIFVNLSYQPFTIVDSLKNSPTLSLIEFLWERRSMGTAWSLMKVFSRSQSDLLVIHGDLHISTNGLTQFLKTSQSRLSNSQVAVHKQQLSKARSIIDVSERSHLVKSFVEVSQPRRNLNLKNDQSQVWSNSGIYYFRLEQLREIDSGNLFEKDIPNSILQQIIFSKKLEVIEFQGDRFSVENPADLEKSRMINSTD